MADPTRRLLRALTRAGDAAGVSIAWEVAEAIPWASALFTGMRYRLTALAERDIRLEDFLAILPTAEVRVPGWYVADLFVRSSDGEIGAQVLLLEE
jgi:hypothetical protein